MRGDVEIALRLDFETDGCVKVSREEGKKIASDAVAKEELLGVDAATAVDEDGRSEGLDPLKCRDDVVINRSFQLSVGVSNLPHVALQLLEGRRLPVSVHLPVHILVVDG